MTGKELVLVMATAGVAGTAAGVGAHMVAQPAPGPDPSAALADRIGALESALARSTKAHEDARAEASQLAERVSQLQADVAAAGETARTAAESARAAPVATEATDRPGRARRPFVLRSGDSKSGGVALGGDAGKTLEFEGADLTAVPEQLRARLGDELGKGLHGLAEGLRLRMLPEKERWDKAKTDVGLQDYQVENLKKAIAERDAAMKESMNVETSSDGASRSFTIRRADPEKMAAANKAYEDKVSGILDSDQRKKWDEKGYNRAFGGPGGGMAMTIIATDEVHVDDAGEKK